MLEKGLSLARRMRTATAPTMRSTTWRRCPSHAVTPPARNPVRGSGDHLRTGEDRAAWQHTAGGLAVVANARGEAERCARLIGAAEGLHEAGWDAVYVYYEPHRSPCEAR